MLLVADVKRNRRRPMTAEQCGCSALISSTCSLGYPGSDARRLLARFQTVHVETNPRYHALLSTFKRRTGCAVLVNTSFNVRGEPIVCMPEDAFRCFMGSDIESLVIGNCLLRKEYAQARLQECL